MKSVVLTVSMLAVAASAGDGDAQQAELAKQTIPFVAALMARGAWLF